MQKELPKVCKKVLKATAETKVLNDKLEGMINAYQVSSEELKRINKESDMMLYAEYEEQNITEEKEEAIVEWKQIKESDSM